MPSTIHTLPEHLIYNILSFRIENIVDIICIGSLNKTFNNLTKKNRLLIIFYKKLYDILNINKKITLYESPLKTMPSFKYWLDGVFNKRCVDGFALINTDKFKESLKILKKYKVDKDIKIKIKWYGVDYLSHPMIHRPSPTSTQQGIRYIIF